ncbi:hypothetical protein [Paenibacillus baekrokdamisoli]|uniref:hypothetical protein n=1 Tax=Paenibacillus baekrokdamisoli TaxID=1712516 RepID=UPI001C84D9D2|nr:hypothetical protein [Paenibacillus baekrokdamisoli]
MQAILISTLFLQIGIWVPKYRHPRFHLRHFGTWVKQEEDTSTCPVGCPLPLLLYRVWFDHFQQETECQNKPYLIKTGAIWYAGHTIRTADRYHFSPEGRQAAIPPFYSLPHWNIQPFPEQ